MIKEVTKGASMGHEDLVIIGRVAGALVIGALIGFERTFHGRPAGFRTHSLVCIASAILMIVTVYQSQWMTFVEHDAIRTDPTRMAQGIMTGIGFLGAGVIFKEGLTVRGLTTAASIWITAAIGILVGIGFWFAAIVGAVAALTVLALFRYIESRLPSEFYAHHMLRFARKCATFRAIDADADACVIHIKVKCLHGCQLGAAWYKAGPTKLEQQWLELRKSFAASGLRTM